MTDKVLCISSSIIVKESRLKKLTNAGLVTIVSCEDKPYQRWQVELLWRSYCWAGMDPDRFVAIVAAAGQGQWRFPCPVFRAPNYCDFSNPSYLGLNRSGGFLRWSCQAKLPDATPILILDPDCCFVRAVACPRLRRGQAIAVEQDFMNPEKHANRKVILRHAAPSAPLPQPVGGPLILRMDDLRAVAGAWFQRTLEISSDRKSWISGGEMSSDARWWISEMWGYSLAAAEAGINHMVRSLAMVSGCQDTPQGRAPIVHYCYRQMFDKTKYKPWAFPDALRNLDQEYHQDRLMLHLLRRVAAMHGYKRMAKAPR